eukprot:scaffold1324_cov117-Isochrysis_galbana.AAC.7
MPTVPHTALPPGAAPPVQPRPASSPVPTRRTSGDRSRRLPPRRPPPHARTAPTRASTHPDSCTRARPAAALWAAPRPRAAPPRLPGEPRPSGPVASEPQRNWHGS